MSQKIKINNKNITSAARQLGMILMTVATVAGLVEMPERPQKAALLTPAYVLAGDTKDANPVRREREEAGPHYISYSATQRTPGRTGRY
ncbi:MAG: hypothetical protein QFB87_04305 [Patescibacteria group bacterium]|nr:hypothetical protein [Patescibacteria group bacterium]